MANNIKNVYQEGISVLVFGLCLSCQSQKLGMYQQEQTEFPPTTSAATTNEREQSEEEQNADIIKEWEVRQDEKNFYYTFMQIQPTATSEEITQAYKKLSREYHPDKARGSKEKMQFLINIYKILSDPTKRADYDLRQNDSNDSPKHRARAYATAVVCDTMARCLFRMHRHPIDPSKAGTPPMPFPVAKKAFYEAIDDSFEVTKKFHDIYFNVPYFNILNQDDRAKLRTPAGRVLIAFVKGHDDVHKAKENLIRLKTAEYDMWDRRTTTQNANRPVNNIATARDNPSAASDRARYHQVYNSNVRNELDVAIQAFARNFLDVYAFYTAINNYQGNTNYPIDPTSLSAILSLGEPYHRAFDTANAYYAAILAAQKAAKQYNFPKQSAHPGCPLSIEEENRMKSVMQSQLDLPSSSTSNLSITYHNSDMGK